MGTVHAKSVDEPPSMISVDAMKARVDKIHIDGLGRTRDDFVIPTVKNLFSANDFEQVLMKSTEVRENLLRSGCFKNVEIFIDVSRGPEATPDGLEVTFTVKELRRIIGGISTEVGNQEGALKIGVNFPNLVGRGEKAQMAYSYSTKKADAFNATISKPLLGKSNGEVLLSLYQQGTEVPYSGYKQLNKGTLLELAFQSAPNIQESIQWDLVWRHLSCLGRATPFAVREHCGHTLKSALRHTIRYDTRDGVILPTEGVLFSSDQEVAGLGGDVGFIKIEAELQANKTIANNVVVQWVAQGGLLSPLQNSKQYRICDSFFLGGPLNIRGFELFGVGPHSEGGSLGAEMFWATGLHLYSPLPLLSGSGKFSDLFRIHGFATAGNIGNYSHFNFGEDYKENVRKLFDGVRLSYGIGLVLRLWQVARLELNYSVPVKSQPGDRICTGLQFGIGASFL